MQKIVWEAAFKLTQISLKKRWQQPIHPILPAAAVQIHLKNIFFRQIVIFIPAQRLTGCVLPLTDLFLY